jgi:hypothetical protein
MTIVARPMAAGQFSGPSKAALIGGATFLVAGFVLTLPDPNLIKH